MGASVSEVRPRPRPNDDLVTACCIARKGNFRHGPTLEPRLEVLLDWPKGGTSGTGRARCRKRVSWRRDKSLESRHEIIESGDEWTEARRSDDVDLSNLPEAGIAQRMLFSNSAGAAARQRAARRRSSQGDSASKLQDAGEPVADLDEVSVTS